jgi:hypothetical protein
MMASSMVRTGQREEVNEDQKTVQISTDLPKLVANAQDGRLRCSDKFWSQPRNAHFSETISVRDTKTQSIKPSRK